MSKFAKKARRLAHLVANSETYNTAEADIERALIQAFNAGVKACIELARDSGACQAAVLASCDIGGFKELKLPVTT